MQFQWAACARHAAWIGSFIALIGLMSGLVRGQEESTENTADTRERLVLFKSGRMMTGQVSRNAGGYLIEQMNGRVQIPADEVKFVVNDLRDAYFKQRDSFVETTPATHLALANWCISYRLHDEARDELKKCLKVDPDNVEARRLLQRLTDTIRSTLPLRPEELVPKKTGDGFQQPAVESLGGLSRDTAIQFTSRVQPMLLHKCGNASCHGTSSPNNFHIISSRVSGRGSRQNSERNLAEVLRYIDTDDVAKSRLLEALKGAHGGKGTIFVGQAASEQIKTVRTWVRVVAQEKQAEMEEIQNQPSVVSKSRNKKRVTQVSAKSEKRIAQAQSDNLVKQASYEEVADTKDDSKNDDDELAKPQELKPDPTDAKALALEPEDAFDPEQFNQRFHRP